jgi:Dyp-type peroxidase family
MSLEENKAVVRRFVEEVFNRRNLAALDEFVATDTSGLASPDSSLSLLLTAFPNVHFTVEDQIAERDTVVLRWTAQGTHTGNLIGIPPTGTLMKGERIDSFRLANGKIVATLNSWDHFGLLQHIDEVPQEPVLEIGEIQGNILTAFNKDHQALLFLQITDVEHAKAWIRRIEPDVATAGEVLTFNRLYKSIALRRGRELAPRIQATWMNMAFSFDGLSKLNAEARQFTDSAFKEGLHHRSQLLGDPTDITAEGHPNNWIIGGPRRVPDVVLILASDSKGNLVAEAERLSPRGDDGLSLIYTQFGDAPPPPNSDHELFGFRDGISQPGIRGRLSEAPSDFLTPRLNPANPHQGNPGQNLIWPGEFVFGYPGQDPLDKMKPGPVAEGGPSWVRNGSFLVFRRYRQDVEAFHSFIRSTARDLARQGISDITPQKLEAKFVGRWASGAPLLRAPDTDNPDIAGDRNVNNDFLFANPQQRHPNATSVQPEGMLVAPDDDAGLLCPHGAHIRKAYPRNDLLRFGAEAAAETHRIIRRGIPFSEAPDNRGLLFLAYQTSIERQFEFILQNWVNNPGFLDTGDGYDPLLGQKGHGTYPRRTFVFPVQEADGTVTKVSIHLPVAWIIPTGGGYFFAPSISALKYLAEEVRSPLKAREGGRSRKRTGKPRASST